jgi:23S rRNA pseudouridine2605 synthase
MAQNHDEGERIAKVMARAGLCSRREAEGWIAAGRVSVNGAKISTPALNVTPRDHIVVDGKPLPGAERTRLFLYHKPRGFVTTTADTHGRPTIFSALPKELPRLVSIGRLDLNTEGLLLLTNDGGLARALELPATGWLRRYRVRAYGKVTQAQLDELRDGVTVDGINYGPIEATLDREQTSNVWITFAIREGKNREVRNVLRHLGLHVARLIRVSFGPFQLGEIADGKIEEVPTRVLREQLGERLAKAAGADFSLPVVERAKKKTPESVPPPARGEAERRQEGEGASRAKPEKKGTTYTAKQKRFHRPKRGEGARPSFDGRDGGSTRPASRASHPGKRGRGQRPKGRR